MAKHEVRTKRGTTPGGRAYASTKWESGGKKGQYTEVSDKTVGLRGLGVSFTKTDNKNTYAKSTADSNFTKAKVSPKGKKITPVAKGPTKPARSKK